MNHFERYFRLTQNGTTAGTEALAGGTTFLTMSYIIFVNPAILADTGMDRGGLVTATVLVAAVSSILMGLTANLPFAIAPGMGLNAFFAYTLVIGQGVSWQTALGAVVLSGAAFLVLTALGFRRLVVAAIPLNLRRAIASGIGLFIAFIGLQKSGFVVANDATLVGFGGFSNGTIFFLAGLAVTSTLVLLRYRAALLLGILVTTTLGLVSGDVVPPSRLVTSPDFESVFLQADVRAALTVAMIAPIFTMAMTDMFDSIASFLGIAQVANILDQNGDPRNIQEALYVDSLATLCSGFFGSSAGTTYIESAAGVEAGGRTGLTAVVVGLLFLPFLFLSSLAEAVPGFATAPALVLVGVFMFSEIGRIDFRRFDEAIPAFLALVLIPLTYSITQGIVWGFISFTTLKIAGGRAKELHPAMYPICALSIAILVLEA